MTLRLAHIGPSLRNTTVIPRWHDLSIYRLYVCARRARFIPFHRLAMTSKDAFMSSPSRPRTSNPSFVSSSSPCLPSLDEIFLKKGPGGPTLRGGNQSASVLVGARSQTTSAADILRTAPEIDIDTETITSSPPIRTKTTSRGCKRNPPTPTKSLHERASHETAVVLESFSPKDKPWNKFKSKDPRPHEDNALSPTHSSASGSRSRPGRATGTVSGHFKTKEEISTSDNNAERSEVSLGGKSSAGETRENIELEAAVPRRTNWTPPRPDKPIVLDSDPDTRELFSSVERASLSKDVFQTLYSQYGRQDPDLATDSSTTSQAEFLRKRKRIELVSTGQEEETKVSEGGPSLNDSHRPNGKKKVVEPKVPVQKKKTRTITELATAPFAAPIVTDFEMAGPSTKDSMLDYFDSDGAVRALVEHQSIVMSQRKPAAKEAKQPPKAKRKRKTGTQANPILLSPSSALKQSSNQDFVFGTSSQLVQEDSPTTLRDLQTAIRASDSLDSDPFEDEVGRRLWHAAARDEDGELIGMEVVDLQSGDVVTTELSTTWTPGSRSFVDIDDLLNSPTELGSGVNGASGSGQPNSRFSQSQATQKPCTNSSGSESSSNIANANPCPNYELFTDAQLTRQITSYGFKPVKKRAAMIALLSQCWASQYQGISASSAQPMSTSAHTLAPARQVSVENVPKEAGPTRKRGRSKKDDIVTAPVAKSSTSKATSPKGTRGRSKKDKTPPAPTAPSSPKRRSGRPRKLSTASIEIPDSESGTPSPASSPDLVFSSPPPLDLTISDEGDISLALSPTDSQTELFKHITKAVISAPRSQDPSQPSWHEKMLLYDPIILEDLAAWLNSGELSRVGYDEEISPLDLKAWCESKSVICLWRQTYRGKMRKRC